MTAVYCFSGSGHSRRIAEYFAERLKVPVAEITRDLKGITETAVVVFPVYCQNVPSVVKDFIGDLKAKRVVLLATYGRISHGNVLWKAKRLTNAEVIAAAYIPMEHSFLNDDFEFNTDKLEPIFERIYAPRPAIVTKERKNPLADIFPAWRSRIGLRIIRSAACNDCGICTRNCPMGAVRNGNINGKCIRCLRCVSLCPNSALI